MKTSIVQPLLLSSASLVAAAPSANAHNKRQEKPGAFYLAGDSTTAGGDSAGGECIYCIDYFSKGYNHLKS